MSIRLKNIQVLDPTSSFYGQVVDFYVAKDGTIEQFKDQKVVQEISGEGKFIFPGLCDMQVNFMEPGFEHKEDIKSGMAAAEKGGITALLQVPNVHPFIDSKETISFVKSRQADSIPHLMVQCAISQKGTGLEMTEVLDASENGADAFGDGYQNTWHSGLLLKSLQYLQHTNKILINQPYDTKLADHGLMHEGVVSTSNGLTGIPSFVESMAISRDLEILEYAGGRLHFAQISTWQSVLLIKKAKKKGLKVTCGVSYFHLLETDEGLKDFDTNNKVMPPLRSEKDRKALLKGVKEGVIDVVVSNHRPQEEDSKKLEFNYAQNGKIGVQTMFIALKTHTDLTDQDLSRVLVLNPRILLNQQPSTLELGHKADFFIASKETYQFRAEEVLSKSRNTSEIGQSYGYKIIGIVKHQNSRFFG